MFHLFRPFALITTNLQELHKYQHISIDKFSTITQLHNNFETKHLNTPI